MPFFRGCRCLALDSASVDKRAEPRDLPSGKSPHRPKSKLPCANRGSRRPRPTALPMGDPAALVVWALAALPAAAGAPAEGSAPRAMFRPVLPGLLAHSGHVAPFGHSPRSERVRQRSERVRRRSERVQQKSERVQRRSEPLRSLARTKALTVLYCTVLCTVWGPSAGLRAQPAMRMYQPCGEGHLPSSSSPAHHPVRPLEGEAKRCCVIQFIQFIQFIQPSGHVHPVPALPQFPFPS